MYYIYIRIYPIAILPDKLFQVEKGIFQQTIIDCWSNQKKTMESNVHPNNYHSWVMGSDNE